MRTAVEDDVSVDGRVGLCRPVAQRRALRIRTLEDELDSISGRLNIAHKSRGNGETGLGRIDLVGDARETGRRKRRVGEVLTMLDRKVARTADRQITHRDRGINRERRVTGQCQHCLRRSGPSGVIRPLNGAEVDGSTRCSRLDAVQRRQRRIRREVRKHIRTDRIVINRYFVNTAVAATICAGFILNTIATDDESCHATRPRTTKISVRERAGLRSVAIDVNLKRRNTIRLRPRDHRDMRPRAGRIHIFDIRGIAKASRIVNGEIVTSHTFEVVIDGTELNGADILPVSGRRGINPEGRRPTCREIRESGIVIALDDI